MKIQILFLFAMLATLISSIGMLRNSSLLPINQTDLHKPSIYAYKDWQSIGLMVNPGEQVEINAQGSWFYTPREYHGPNGHPIYLAPDFYPLPYAAGGVLIGRIGEEGVPFVIGEHSVIDEYYFLNSSSVDSSRLDATGYGGILYLRINDDILSDNDGAVTVDIEVIQTTENSGE